MSLCFFMSKRHQTWHRQAEQIATLGGDCSSCYSLIMLFKVYDVLFKN